MNNHALLFEIGMEECPARFVASAAEQFEMKMGEALVTAGLKAGDVQLYATPRRLAVIVHDVPAVQPDATEEIKGPPANISYDESHQPTKAAVGFAKSQEVSVDELVVKETSAGRYIYAIKTEAGRRAKDVLPELLRSVILSLTFPKSMRWGDFDLRFVRPIRWIVAMLDGEVLPVEIEGIGAGNVTYGHRTLCTHPIVLTSALDYAKQLESEGFVVGDVGRRVKLIQKQLDAIEAEVGGRIEEDADLLNEVTYLVEWPTTLSGRFDDDYLKLPEDVLTTTMKAHQKYFPVKSDEGGLLPVFVTVRNGDGYALDNVRAGNERVLAARLADARFFFEEDQKTPLINRVDDLKNVLFQEKLGSVLDKVERVRQICTHLGGHLTKDRLALLDRAALLCKTDLLTQMVSELPELQGVMGREYALLSGEDRHVADAVWEHYLPRHSGDVLPQGEIGTLLSIADKIDTIVGCFGIGLVPTGSSDPYALRRQALGLIRMMLKAERLTFSLNELLDVAIKQYGDTLYNPDETKKAVMQFFAVRLKNRLVEKGSRSDLVDAALQLGVDDVQVTVKRVAALSEAVTSGILDELVAARDRAANLGAKSSGNSVDTNLFTEEAERVLWDEAQRVSETLAKLVSERRFREAIQRLTMIKAPIARFFDDVLVMVEDENIRMNRLALLREVAELFNSIAAFELIQT